MRANKIVKEAPEQPVLESNVTKLERLECKLTMGLASEIEN